MPTHEGQEHTNPDYQACNAALWDDNSPLYKCWSDRFPNTQDGQPLLETLVCHYTLATDVDVQPVTWNEDGTFTFWIDRDDLNQDRGGAEALEQMIVSISDVGLVDFGRGPCFFTTERAIMMPMRLTAGHCATRCMG